MSTRNSKRVSYYLLAIALTALACNLPSVVAPPSSPIESPAPSATASPTVPPTPTTPPTPTPVPTPTPLPADLLAISDQALFVGDTAAALAASEAALAGTSDEQTSAAALYNQARAHVYDQAFLSAIVTLRDLIERFPESEQARQAHLLLGQAHMAAGEPLTAADEYRIFLQSETGITPYVQDWIGDALRTGADYAGAISAYQEAIAFAPNLTFELAVREKLALAYVALSDYDSAMSEYDTILARSQVTSYRARIAHQAAETLRTAGRYSQAYDRHLAVIDEFSTNSWAYQSLVVLVEAGVPVDDLTRGIVDYYGGAYDASVAVLYRYVDSSSIHEGRAHYFAGLALLYLDDPVQAQSQFEILVETHPESDYWGSGYMGWAEALADQGYIDDAVAIYREFVAAAPAHSRAPEALWKAAQLLEGADRPQEAASAYEECQASYPASDTAAPSLLRAGLQRYRLGDMIGAAADWDILGNDYPGSEYQAAGLFWLGKAHLAAGRPISATAAFEEAVTVAPMTYYGLRAADLIDDPLTEPFPLASYTPIDDPPAGQAEAEEWLAAWLQLPSTTGLSQPGEPLAQDPRMERGMELWHLGYHQEAKTEFESLRRETADDPLAQYQLALLFRDIGLYRSSILAAANLIELSPAESPLDAPAFIARLAYPTYYEDLVLSDALAEDLPPLLVFALMRQESLFEGFATSFAYAHGLMQVIPSTGAGIASQLGWPPGYETSDLYRPHVSVRFGTYYLAQQRDLFDGRRDAALAAYNGGPGNALRWLDAAGDDPDLFLEAITLGETRLYLLLIREHYAYYAQLY